MNNTHIIKGLLRFLDESLSKISKVCLIAMALMVVSCELDALTDLTPNDGLRSEFAFNIPEFNKAISTESTRQDTGWHVVTDVPIRVSSPFVYDIQYIATDTFAFNWNDYKPVLQRIHRIANGQDITGTHVHSNFTWLNAGMYSTPKEYLIPLFNIDGSRYWLQVFREQKSFFQTIYTARGIWAISKPKKIEGDVS